MGAQDICDIFIIGGGINGCGIARDAAGRGYSVALAEMNDLASATSSGSTKLIHGGLRYLEHYEFRLVREALMEREVLWAIAPHIVRPMRFVLPHHKGLRPAWMLRLGLFLYDHLGGRKLLPGTATLKLSGTPIGAPLHDRYVKAFEYSDCWIDDARLVVLNAKDAATRGARIMTRTKVTGATRQPEHWELTLQPAEGPAFTVKSRFLVNAAGPWVDDILIHAMARNDAQNVRLVRGSHIVVPKLFDHDRSYIFQNADGRVVFAIPYEEDFTLIGTTDVDHGGSPDEVRITEDETAYLCTAIADYLQQPVMPEDVVWHYSAVRPLYDDGASKAQEATRDYVIKTESDGGAPLLNIFGGKITTYRRLAENALDEIGKLIGNRGASWSGNAPLPGGDFPPDGTKTITEKLRATCPFLEESTAARLARLYGNNAFAIIDGCQEAEDLGINFGADLTEKEVQYLQQHEWAVTAEDILWRRTKLGLKVSQQDITALAAYLAEGHKTSAVTLSAS